MPSPRDQINSAVGRILGDRDGFSLAKPSRNLEGAFGATSGQKGCSVLVIVGPEPRTDLAPFLQALGNLDSALIRKAGIDLSIAAVWHADQKRTGRLRKWKVADDLLEQLDATKDLPPTTGTMQLISEQERLVRGADLTVILAGREGQAAPGINSLRNTIRERAMVITLETAPDGTAPWFREPKLIADRNLIHLQLSAVEEPSN